MSAGGMFKATRRVEELLADDRFVRNGTEIADVLYGHIANTMRACQKALDALEPYREVKADA